MSADRPTSSAERASMLQDMPIARAADGTAEDTSYPQLRAEFMGRSDTATLVPPFVCTSRNLDAFWDWIRDEGTSYSVRRRIIWEAFAPLLDYLEDENRAPAAPASPPLWRTSTRTVCIAPGPEPWTGGRVILRGPSQPHGPFSKRSASVSSTKRERPMLRSTTSPSYTAAQRTPSISHQASTPSRCSARSWAGAKVS
jgi:hypothetical protein